MKKMKWTKRVSAMAMALLLLFTLIPGDLFPTVVNAETGNQMVGTRVADASTAMSYQDMLGDDADGNRYAGRIWVDKSVYADGTYAQLIAGEVNGGTLPTLGNNEFMTVYSALGSSTEIETTTTVKKTQPRDIVLVIDMSQSMSNSIGSGRTRLNSVIEAANSLVSQIDNGENRIGIVTYYQQSETLMALDKYTDMAITVTNNSGSGNSSGKIRVTAKDGTGENVSKDYEGNIWTNTQSGIDRGMEMLINAENKTGRAPVIIVLSDGDANRASTSSWSNPDSTLNNTNNNTTGTAEVIMTTILNAAYNKVRVSKAYGVTPLVFTVGVDLSTNGNAQAILDPGTNFKSTYNNSRVKDAYELYEDWQEATQTFTSRDSNNSTFTIEQVPSGVTKDEVKANIGYADKFYEASTSAANSMAQTFADILNEMTKNDGLFSPITDTITINNQQSQTPLTYVDPIGDYMQLNDIHAVTVYGKKYVMKSDKVVNTDVVANPAGGYAVTKTTQYSIDSNEEITDPIVTTNKVAINDAISIELIDTYTIDSYQPATESTPAVEGEKTSVSDQTLWIRIKKAALPIIKSKAVSKDGVVTYTKTEANPVRVYYTVGVSDDILSKDGEIIMTTKIDSAYLNNPKNQGGNGTINLYTNQFGVLAPNTDSKVVYGDTHASITPSTENRYYYHKTNYAVYDALTKIVDDVEIAVDFDEETSDVQYGIPWYHGNGTTEDYNTNKNLNGYNVQSHVLTLSEIDDVNEKSDDEEVYSFITFYRPSTSSGTNTGEVATYLVKSTWGQMKEGVAYYDMTKQEYITSANSTNADHGQHIDISVAKAYAQANNVPVTKIAVCLGVDSWRVSRLSHMELMKVDAQGAVSNPTGTAQKSYAPMYDDKNEHVGDLVVWLGNNGKLTVEPTQGFSLTKRVEGNVDKTEFDFEVVFSSATTAFTPSVRKGDGTKVTTGVAWDETNNKLTIKLKKDETVYVVNVPKDVTYTVKETTTGNFDVSINDPLNSSPSATYNGVVVNNTFTNIIATNTEKGKGGVYITKEVASTTGSTPSDDLFTITATVSDNSNDNLTVTTPVTQNGATVWQPMNKVDSVNSNTDYYYDATNKQFTFKLKKEQTVHIDGLTDGATVTVTESTMPTNNKGTYAAANPQYTDTVGEKDGIVTITENQNAEVVVHNTYTANPITFTDFSMQVIKNIPASDIGAFGSVSDFKFALQKYVYENNVWTWKTIVDEITIAVPNTSPSSTDADFRSDVSIAWTEALKQHFTFTEPGDYAYQIVEIAPNTPSEHLTYDHTQRTFGVHVENEGGELKATVHAHEAAYDAPSKTIIAEFTNEYHTAEVRLNIRKSVTDNSASGQHGGGFKFEAYAADANWNTSGTPITGETDASGELRWRSSFNHSHFTNGNTQTNYYVVKEVQNTKGTAGAWQYDPAEYRVTVTLTRNNAESEITSHISVKKVVNGEESEVTNDVVNGNTLPNSATLTFTNTYTAQRVRVTPNVEKVLVGRNITANDNFAFKMNKVGTNDNDGAPNLIEGTVSGDGTNNKATVTFDEAYFTKVGTFNYHITEVKGNNNAITYDPSEHHVTVTVVDNNGQLEATYSYAGGSDKITFTNTYSAQSTVVNVAGTKALTGEPRILHANEFGFKLTGTVGTQSVELTTSNNEDGTFRFEPIIITQADMAGAMEKTFTFTVTEIDPADDGNDETARLGGMTYDPAVYTVTVKVTDNGTGALSASTPTYKHAPDANTTGADAPNGIVFTNTYDPTLGENEKVVITGTKQLVGRDWVEGEEFEFALLENGQVVKTAKATAPATGGNPNFSITLDHFDKTGTHHYVLAEVIPTSNTAGMIYDETKYEITVHVLDDGNGTLTTVEHMPESMNFTNTYDPTEVKVVLEGLKKLEGRTLEAGEFSFSLYRTDETYTIPDGATPRWTVQNDESGKFVFPEATFTAATTNYYVLVEEPYAELKDGTYVKDGVTYDPTAYKIEIKVADHDENGYYAKLQAIANVQVPGTNNVLSGSDTNGVLMITPTEEVLNFTNIYDPDDTKVEFGDSAEADIQTKKTLTGKVLNGEDFKFKLSEASVINGVWTKRDEIETVKNTASGSIVFTTLNYETVGTHFYVVEEINEGKGGIVYDDTLYYVTVEVTDDLQGKLHAETTIMTNKSNDAVDAITFKNDYVIAENDKLKLEGSKTLNGKELEKGQFEFNLYNADENFTQGKKIQTVKNDADGSVVFSKLKFKQPGEYHYIVREEIGNAENYTYDESVWHITVTATDNGKGELLITTTAVVKGTTEDKGTFSFVNTYKEPEPTATPTPTAEPTAAPEATATPKPSSGIPGTGDTANLTAWLAVLAVGVVGAVTALIVTFRRKRTATGKHYK